MRNVNGKYARLTFIAWISLKNHIKDFMSALRNFLRCFPYIRTPEFIVFSKSLFERKVWLVSFYIRPCVSFVASVDSIFLPAILIDLLVLENISGRSQTSTTTTGCG